MKKHNETKQHDAFAEMFVEEIQVITRQPLQEDNETENDPWVVFAYWVLLPMFFASITVMVIAILNLIF